MVLLGILLSNCQQDSKKGESTSAFIHQKPTTAQELLARSIKFHDPDDNWHKFVATLTLKGERPDGSVKTTEVIMNNPRSFFAMKRRQEGLMLEQGIEKDSCFVKVNNESEVSDSLQKKYKLTCKRTTLMRNYYSYLYGLPMKLKDEGTQIDEQIKQVKFQGEDYLSMRVTYDAKVGKDTWYFYFNPTTYALSGYRFYHDEAKNDGEYITLEGLETIKGIKIPKIRAWYINKDDKFLGKDILLRGH